MSRRALLVSGSPGDTRRYRVLHPAEALELRGWEVRVRALERPETAPRDEDLEGVDLVLLHRVAWDERVAGLASAARARGASLLFETDDLVFAPEAEARFAALRAAEAQAEAEARAETIAARAGARPIGASALAAPERYRATLQACAGALVATEALADAVGALGRPARVLRNAIDLELLRLSTEALAAPAARDPETVVLGYASGTASHDRDFARIGPLLRSLFDRDPRLRLHVIGPLRLEPDWAPFQDRIRRTPFVPWRALPALLAGFDVNLAPLETGDAFCEAKSELKFVEAGAVGVPTVASATAAFRHAIRDGQDGFVAAFPGDWGAALRALTTDPARRRAMGLAARATVIDRYVTDLRGEEIETALDELGRHGRGASTAPADAQGTPTTFFAVTRDAEGEPYPAEAPILRAAAEAMLAAENADDTVVDGPAPASRPVQSVPSDAADSEATAAAEERASGVVELPRSADGGGVAASATMPGARAGLGVATGTSALPAARVSAESSLLLLDDLPGLDRWAMGADFVAAEAAAAAGPTAALGPFVAAWLSERLGNDEASAVPYPLDLERFWPGPPAEARPARIAFDLAPGPAAELTSVALGLSALALALDIEPALEVVLFSSEPDVEPPTFEASSELEEDQDAPDPLAAARWAGTLDAEGRAALLREAAALLLPGAANPGLAALEAMACGCAPVALDAGAGRWLLVDGATAFLAPPDPDALGVAIVRALLDAGRRARVVAGGRAAAERHSRGRTAAALRRAMARATVAATGPGSAPASAATATTATTILDHLQPLVDGPAPAGAVVGQTITPRFDGLCRIDLRLDRAPSAETPVALRIRRSPGDGPALATVALPEGPLLEGGWAAFRFAPLAGTAGRPLYLEWVAEGEDAPRPLWVDEDRFPAGRTYVDGRATSAATLAFRSFCRPGPPPLSLAAPAETQRVLDEIRTLAHRSGERWQELEALEATAPYRLALWWNRQRQPLPPMDERPWPADARVHAKLWGTLRHYGPLAALREAGSFTRWLRMSQQERDAVVEREG